MTSIHRYTAAISVFCLALLLAPLSATAATSKPSSPMAMTLTELAPQGSVRTFQLQLSTQVDLSAVQVQITTDPVLAPFSGTLQWQGAVKAQTPLVLEFSFNTSEPLRINAHATAHLGEGVGFGAAARLVDPAAKAPAAGVQIDRDDRLRERNGRPVHEYPIN